MTSEQQQKLQELRQEVLAELVGMTENLADDEDVSYELLLTLARNSDKPDLLHKALPKIKQIEDSREKMSALLELLDETEAQINIANTDSSDSKNSTSQTPDTISVQQNG